MSIRSAHASYYFLALFTMVLPFLNPFIKGLTIPLVLFLTSSAFYLFFLAQKGFSISRQLTTSFVWIAYLSVNVLVSTLHNIPLLDSLRSIVPFLFYPFVLLILNKLTFKHAIKIPILLILIALISSITSLIIMYGSNNLDLNAFSGGYRITFDDSISAIPISIAALPFIIFTLKKKIFYIPFTILVFFQILATQSKGLIGLGILTILIKVIYATFSSKGKNRIIMILFGFSLLTLILAIFVSNFKEIPFLQRFLLVGTSSDVTTLGRLQEIKHTIAVFLKYPLLGIGNGYSFEHINNVGELEYRRYTHNAIFYFLSTTGLVGLLIYYYMLLRPVYVYRKIVNKKWSLKKQLEGKVPKYIIFNNYKLALILSLFNIYTYSLVSASYKLIHINIIIGLLHLVIFRTTKEWRLDERNINISTR